MVSLGHTQFNEDILNFHRIFIKIPINDVFCEAIIQPSANLTQFTNMYVNY